MIEELRGASKGQRLAGMIKRRSPTKTCQLLQVTRATIFLAFIPNYPTSHQLYIVHRGYDVNKEYDPIIVI